MLKGEFVRNGKTHITGTKTSGFGNGGTVTRDSIGKISAVPAASSATRGTHTASLRASIRQTLYLIGSLPSRREWGLQWLPEIDASCKAAC